VKGSIGEVLIVDKMKENRPRWFVIWACDEARGNKISKSNYENEC
jgi:hypothetical protein